MGDIQKDIEAAETKWLNKSYTYIKQAFENDPLPSHDHFHHLRVWKHARFLLEQIDTTGKVTDPGFIESLLISCMFHDTGMTETKEKEHGSASREICENFFSSDGNKPENPELILTAIEMHDDKSYRGFGPLVKNNQLNLITALSIADDMDAFGYTGIYRYTEIYLMRGVPIEDLGLKVIANLSGRFNHFMSNCSGLQRMISTYIPRYNIIESFFRNYNLQVRKIEAGENSPAGGPVGVAKQIYRHSLMNAISIRDVAESVLESESDPYITQYFRDLINELDA